MPKVNFDAAKWARRSAGASSDYAAGVASPKRSQSASAIASKDVWSAALQAAIGAGSYEKGLQKSGDSKWQKGVREVGQTRYSQGVSNPTAQSDISSGFAPFKATIESLDLGPKGPKGTNYNRVNLIGEALRATKASL